MTNTSLVTNHNSIIKSINIKIDELVYELKYLNYWQNSRPSDDCFKSEAPFFIDKMTFAEWLQWVFIVQLKKILENQNFYGLENESNIYSMATHVFASYPENTNKLCSIIKDVDDLLNSFPKLTYH